MSPWPNGCPSGRNLPATTPSKCSCLWSNTFSPGQSPGPRAPHSNTATELGQAVAAVAKELKVSILVFGSTDLTHYGPNYGFAPKGYGSEAVKWVKEVNDKKFIDQALKLDGPGMLKAAQADQSACSAGGAVAAVAAAKAQGARKAALIDYYTSYDVMPGDSFVGYAGMVLEG